MKNAKQPHPSLTSLRWARRLVVVALIAFPMLSASWSAGYRIAMWRVDATDASRVAADMSQPDADRIRALLTIDRDVRRCADLLRAIATEPGPVGDQARQLLSTSSESPSPPPSRNRGR